MSLTPQNPDWEAVTRGGFARQPFMAEIGAEAVSIEPGVVTLALAFADRLTQGNGFLHAGVVAALLDNACGWAAGSLMPAGVYPLTAEYKISLMRPAAGARLIATATVLKPGRTLMFCEAVGEMEQDGARKLVAKLSASIACVGVGVGAEARA